MPSSAWQEAFAAFEAKKTAAAMRAQLAPYVTTGAYGTANLRAIGTPWSTAAFGGPFYVREPTGTRLPTCSLVFVQSADGNTVTEDPTSLGGGATDYHVVYEGLSRVSADAVLVGSRTLRGSDTVFSVSHPEMLELRKTSGLARHPAQLVTTRRGIELDQCLLFNIPALPVILLTEADGAAKMKASLSARPWIRLIILTNRTDLIPAFTLLRASGIGRISCVGGRSLAADLLDLELVDDVYLTTSAREGGTPDTPLSPRAFDGRLVLEKQGTNTDVGVVFEHRDLTDRGRV